MVDVGELRRLVRGPVRLSESLGPFSALGVGGSADFYLEPARREDLLATLQYLMRRSVPVILVRRRANFLASDDGFRGAAVNVETALGGVTAEGTLVRAEAGVPLARLVDFAVGRSLGGLEALAGEPGTVGGALVRGVPLLRSMLQSVEIFDGERERTAGPDELRSSTLLLAATLRLAEVPAEKLMRARREQLLDRNRRTPLNLPNGTVAFRDPDGASAARLIEEAGLRGMRHGGAMLSERHANVVLNTGRATAADVAALLRTVQRTVAQKLHRRLELQTTLVGFRRELSAA